MSHDLTRRTLLKGTLKTALAAPLAGSALVSPLFARRAFAAGAGSAGPEAAYQPDQFPADFQLFTAADLPQGGQLEVRMFKPLDMYVHPASYDPDDVEIANNLLWFNPESWYENHLAAAQKNEALAVGATTASAKNKYYRRATNYYKTALTYLCVADSRMLPTYGKLDEMYNSAWAVVRPPFERIEIPYEGHLLQGEFYAAGGKAPVVVAYSGADGIMLGGSPSGGTWTSRGMSYLTFDAPGQGGTLRIQKLYAPPDTERIGQAVVDYLATRSDVDMDRLGIYGSSFGGYTAPRVCTVVKEFKACGCWSGAFSGLRDLFDYYPPIRERMRWLIGARNMEDARGQMQAYTLENRVRNITAALMVGYSTDDRVMNPYGALELYDRAVNAASREKVVGTGHAGPNSYAIDRNAFFADWFAKQLS